MSSGTTSGGLKVIVTERLRVSRDTFEFILAEIKNDIVKQTYSNETPSHTSCHSVGNVPVSTYSWVFILDGRGSVWSGSSNCLLFFFSGRLQSPGEKFV